MTEGRLPTARQLLDTAAATLEAAGVPSARHDAQELLSYSYGLPHVEVALAPPVTEQVVATMREVVRRRREREPLQLIVGTTVFRYVTVRTAPGVFVPRPETEVVAGAAIAEVQALCARGRSPEEVLVVDLCTGTGAIAASVASETGAQVVAVDVSETAVELARANVAAVAGSARVELGDVREVGLLAELAGSVDVLVANPPYIPPEAVPIDPEVRDHDPELALYGGGTDGLALPRAVVATAQRLLRAGGLLVVEHAEVQGGAMRALAAATSTFEEITTGSDLTGRERYLRARRTA